MILRHYPKWVTTVILKIVTKNDVISINESAAARLNNTKLLAKLAQNPKTSNVHSSVPYAARDTRLVPLDRKFNSLQDRLFFGARPPNNKYKSSLFCLPLFGENLPACPPQKVVNLAPIWAKKSIIFAKYRCGAPTRVGVPPQHQPGTGWCWHKIWYNLYLLLGAEK